MTSKSTVDQDVAGQTPLNSVTALLRLALAHRDYSSVSPGSLSTSADFAPRASTVLAASANLAMAFAARRIAFLASSSASRAAASILDNSSCLAPDSVAAW